MLSILIEELTKQIAAMPLAEKVEAINSAREAIHRVSPPIAAVLERLKANSAQSEKAWRLNSD